MTELGVIDSIDNYAQLRRDVVRETLQYEQRISQSANDLVIFSLYFQLTIIFLKNQFTIQFNFFIKKTPI